jgi:adenylate cyclase class IV
MKMFAILKWSFEKLTSLIEVNKINSVGEYINIEWTQEIENICLLHNISMYQPIY